MSGLIRISIAFVCVIGNIMLGLLHMMALQLFLVSLAALGLQLTSAAPMCTATFDPPGTLRNGDDFLSWPSEPRLLDAASACTGILMKPSQPPRHASCSAGDGNRK